MIEFNKKNENPFYGLKNCISLFQGKDINYVILDRAYDEVKEDKTKREMFYSLLFSIGDITNRNHNLFKNKPVDNGGQSNREGFYIIMNWMIKNDYEQFLKFLWAGLFNEYTCFDHLFRNRVKTFPGTKNVISTYNMLSKPKYREDLADYVVSIIKGNNPFNKLLVAKFLTIPRLGKRKGHKEMLYYTYQNMYEKAQFIKLISIKMNWAYVFNGGFFNPVGYRIWRKQYNSDLESVLFSTGKIREFDKLEFINWLNKLPSEARFRVKKHVYVFKDPKNPKLGYKWDNLKDWYSEWENFKKQAQNEQRELTEKVRQGTATIEDKLRLKEVVKDAKVTVGASNFSDLYQDICNGDFDEVKIESFINKVNLPFNFLTIVDDSGSMQGAPINFAMFLATLLLLKNPNDTARDLIGLFSNTCRFYSKIDRYAEVRNSFWHTPEISRFPATPLIDSLKSFVDNYNSLSGFVRAVGEYRGTYPDSIVTRLEQIANESPEAIDEFKKYPVWVICSDGDFSRGGSKGITYLQESSQRLLGFVPFIVLVEVGNFNNYKITEFSDVDQFIYIPGKPELIEQMLINFKDIDVMDIYTPLLSIYRSNRYLPVRNCVI